MIACIGFIAFFTSCISLLPQIYRTYKTKSVEDISIAMLWNFFISSMSWVAYGILIHSLSVWITNVFMVITSLFMLGFKFKYRVRLK